MLWVTLGIAGTAGDLTVENNTFTNANQGIRFFSINAAGLGPVTIDNNTLEGLRQGIVADSDGDLNNISVTNNTLTDNEEGIRVKQEGLSISGNTFSNAGAFTAFVIDETGAYLLNDILTGNTFTPNAEVGTTGGFDAIVEAP